MANLDIQTIPARRSRPMRGSRAERIAARRASVAPPPLEMEMASLDVTGTAGAAGAAGADIASLDAGRAGGAAAAQALARLALVAGSAQAVPVVPPAPVAAPALAPAADAGTEAPRRVPAEAPLFSYPRAGKRCLDLVLLAIFLPVYLPVIALAALALMIEGGRPFYRQDRLGRKGERFSILKLRTMVPDAEARLQALLADDPELRREWEVSQKLKHDPRITRVGELLRRTSLDELPQLWNVAKGEMSLVGPRPMMPDQLPLYGDPQDYFALRPGITGLWQVDRRNESSFAERARYDSTYRQEISLARDLGVLWQTIGVVLRRTGR